MREAIVKHIGPMTLEQTRKIEVAERETLLLIQQHLSDLTC